MVNLADFSFLLPAPEFWHVLRRFAVVSLIDLAAIVFYFSPHWRKFGYDARKLVRYQCWLFGVAALISLADSAYSLGWWKGAVIVFVCQSLMVLSGFEDLLYGVLASMLGLRKDAFPATTDYKRIFIVMLPAEWPWLGHHVGRVSNLVLIAFGGEKVELPGLLQASFWSLVFLYSMTKIL